MKILIPVLLISTCLFFGCSESGVNPSENTDFSIAATEVASTEAVITLHSVIRDSITVKLKRDNQTMIEALRMKDKIVIDDTLLIPARAYSYTAYLIDKGRVVDSTFPLHIETKQLSGDQFIWNSYFFGDPSIATSSLSDVSILSADPLSIYAVGEIHIKDSAGEDKICGLVQRNGSDWYLKNILVQSQQGGVYSRIFNGIIVFNDSDIWLGDGNAFHWDGQNDLATAYWISGYPGNPTPILDPDQGVNKFGGVPNFGIYGGGVNGGLAYFKNGLWKKLESGTNNQITDVWGVMNPSTNAEEVYCATHDHTNPDNSTILKITNTTQIDSIEWNEGRGLYSVWTYNGTTLYAAGSGLWKRSAGSWKQVDLKTTSVLNSIRGTASNDIFLTGVFGLAAHYNGKEWKIYTDIPDGDAAGASYSALAMKGNIVVLVGIKHNGQAIITIGRR